MPKTLRKPLLMEVKIIRQTLNLEYTMFFLNQGTAHE